MMPIRILQQDYHKVNDRIFGFRLYEINGNKILELLNPSTEKDTIHEFFFANPKDAEKIYNWQSEQKQKNNIPYPIKNKESYKVEENPSSYLRALLDQETISLEDINKYYWHSQTLEDSLWRKRAESYPDPIPVIIHLYTGKLNPSPKQLKETQQFFSQLSQIPQTDADLQNYLEKINKVFDPVEKLLRGSRFKFIRKPRINIEPQLKETYKSIQQSLKDAVQVAKQLPQREKENLDNKAKIQINDVYAKIHAKSQIDNAYTLMKKMSNTIERSLT